ncbi:MAG: winged helix-turn-helix domain-containing protein [Candidatus Hermodarchaeota archaeon]
MGHELRRRIITIIGDNTYTSFTHLKKELKVSTGTIYHHLETLSELIEQKEDKKYYLKELGIYAYNSLKNNIETIRTPQKGFGVSSLKKLMVLSTKRFIEFNKEDRIYTILISISLITLGTVFCNLNGFSSFLLFYIDANHENLILLYQVLINLSFVLNFFAFFIIVEAIIRILYKRDKNVLDFFISFALIQFPMVIYLIIHFIFEYTTLISINIFNFTDNILMIVFQVWSLWLLSYSLNVKKGLKFENSFIIALLLHMLPFTLIMLTFI